MFRMQIHGGAEFAKNLNSLSEGLRKRYLYQILREAAEPMRARMASNAPRDPETAADIKANIVMSPARRIGSVEGGKWSPTDERMAAIAVGPAAKSGDVYFYYGLHIEYGTVHIDAKSFARPAFDNVAPQSLKIIQENIWNRLRTIAAANQKQQQPTGGSGGSL